MPWGARRSARIAHYFSLAITHITNKYIPQSLHPYVLDYIDDHIFRGTTRLECLYVHIMYILVCNYLRVKLKAPKTVLVAQRMIALGFDIDLHPMQRTIDIEQYKQQKYDNNLQAFLDTENHTTQQGQQLAGQLEYVAPLKWPLKCYIRALHNAIPNTLNPHTPLQMTSNVTNSLKAWQRAIKLLNPTKLKQITNPPTRFDIQLITDSSNIGYGWITGTQWAFGAFFPDEVDADNQHNIRERELYPIATALTNMAPKLSYKHILIWSDNDNAVQALANKDIRNEESQQIVIYICELAMKYNFRFYIRHIKGKANAYADALSRLQVPLFLQKCKQNNKTIDKQPTPHTRIPIQLGNRLHLTHAPCKIDNSLNPT